MSGEVLIVVHQKHSTPGKVGECLTARGYTLDRCCPCLGDPLPTDVSGYAALVVFGGPQSANDDHVEGIRAELNWLERTALPSDRPLLGICLGAQEIARVLGARVGRHPEGRVEIGYWEVRPTGAADGFLSEPTSFYQWHSETFEIPGCSVHLAENDHFPSQAYCCDGRIWGIEFHPEMTREMVERWSTSERGRAKLTLNGARPAEEHCAGYARFADNSDRWLNEFLDRHLLGRERG
jgi:GMP synthase (glutamine-hydrolysing)